jgi:hypothetical protein
MSRRQVLTAGASAALAATVVSPAGAALPAATPIGDDLGFLAFGAVAEGVLTEGFDAALRLRGAWSPRERRWLRQARDRHHANIRRLNAALGPEDAVASDDFTHHVRVATRAGALKVGRELETLTGGVYLSGTAAAADDGTRLLLGRLLALTSGHHALLAGLAGDAPPGLPVPVDLDTAGLTLDTYLREPSS